LEGVTMMHEIKYARKYDGGKRVRWFSDRFFDLSIWFDEDEDIASFQLTYDKYSDEHAITWRRDRGFLHEKIDDGEVPGRHKKSPILIPDGIFPKEPIADRFEKESVNIDPVIREFVHKKILDYS
jgi:hypothetical protein